MNESDELELSRGGSVLPGSSGSLDTKLGVEKADSGAYVVF